MEIDSVLVFSIHLWTVSVFDAQPVVTCLTLQRKRTGCPAVTWAVKRCATGCSKDYSLAGVKLTEAAVTMPLKFPREIVNCPLLYTMAIRPEFVPALEAEVTYASVPSYAIALFCGSMTSLIQLSALLGKAVEVSPAAFAAFTLAE